MTDYSKMSDFEINKAVALSLGGFEGDDILEPPGVIFKRHGKFQYSFFDPCNNPSDAWPIIASSRISIEFDGDGSTEPQSVWCNVTNFQRTCGIKYQKNPLRAAMIVYLMMKDSENEN